AVFGAPPTNVAITAPANGTNLGVLSSPGNVVTVEATAAPSSSGFITQVVFRINGTTVGTDTAAPFSFQWTPTTPGTYSITAEAIDSSAASNNSLISAPVTVTVGGVRLATVTSPSSNATLPQGSQL